ncbi:hypothetical protein TMatcc_004277 [Talaromyces marneffei ATCC 18224]|uniref:Extracellular membrane protein CFEM domain-containing protein n=1 Tax=Talaromyces marneffei (strain ATCC 18224 / CBS 334.59 / QM 7333) TaxID=441960 RepID=B6Q5F7_TALMQ|nr:uncharacterized protein EYB26_000762 [Talaromyces marneffei]EEA27432.1 hypothetical protein PMAA_023080 [Talaromyces marneffei ATCC 18224]KAE8556866.1 hypothetical protein EYB25_001572 [Talaromyces marneffei]QGA13117.1 hypothetical protein EYB26_000762 [Talaromyces marneffei]
MRSLVTLIAFAAAATAATSPLVAREDAAACAMRTLLSSTTCNTGDAACLCSDGARQAVMEEIKSACGSEQSDLTNNMATEACRTQKVRRATLPSATVVHMGLATPSSTSANRMNGVQEAAGQDACSCPNTKSKTPNAPSANNAADTEMDQESEMPGKPSHGSNTPSGNSAQSSHAHAPSMMATPSASSAAHHGLMASPTAASSSRATNPTDASSFSTFRGAGSQAIPSLTVVAGGVLAGVVGIFAAL